MNSPSITAFAAGIAVASGAGIMAAVEPGDAAPATAATTQSREVDASAPRRCAECGRIAAAREITSDADNRAVRVQEYTVRMSDGSTRTFTSRPDVRWRIGET